MMLLLISDGLYNGPFAPPTQPNPPLIKTYGIDLQTLEGEYNEIRMTAGSLQCHDRYCQWEKR